MSSTFDSVSGQQLRVFIERIERLDEEIKALNTDKSEVYAEAKGNGFDVKVMRKVIAIRRQDHNERMEQEAILELYLAALGMAPAFDDEDEVGTAVATRAPARATRLTETPVSHAPVQPGREEPGTTDGAASTGEHGALIQEVSPPGAAPASGEAGEANQARNLIPPASPANQSDRTKPNPWCADPDDCGVEASWNFPCGACLRRRAASNAAEAVQ